MQSMLGKAITAGTARACLPVCTAGLSHSKGQGCLRCQAMSWKPERCTCLRGALLNSWPCWLQELVEIVGRSAGIVLMTPPSENKAAQATMNTLLSACNSKQKVRRGPLSPVLSLLMRDSSRFVLFSSCAAALQGAAWGAQADASSSPAYLRPCKLPCVTLGHCPCHHLMKGEDSPSRNEGTKQCETRQCKALFGRSCLATEPCC